MKYLFYVLSLLCGLLCAASAQAQIAVTHTSSVCIDPPDLFVIASTEKDKDQYKNCKRWSSLSNTAEIFNINDFMKSDSSIPPVNRFAKAIIYNWTGKNHVSPLPTSFLLYERPLQFGLEEVNRNSEERLLKTLIVWKPKIKDGSGMIAYVVCDNLDVAVGSPPLAKYLVLYPSFSGEGALRTRNAAQLAESLRDVEEPRFLRPYPVPLFWNKWISDIEKKEQQQIYVRRPYVYNIDFSALDFQLFSQYPAAVPRVPLKKEEARTLLPNFDVLQVTMFPIGGTFADEAAKTSEAIIKMDRLTDALVMAPPRQFEHAEHKTIKDLSERYGALLPWRDSELLANPVRFSFTPSRTGCGYLAVVIWNKTKDRVIASWLQPIEILPDPDDPAPPGAVPAFGESSSLLCVNSSKTAQRYVSAAAPRFFQQSETDFAPRLTFLDLGNVTIGTFEDPLNGEAAPFEWVLQGDRGLKEELPKEITEHVNRYIKDPDDHPFATGDRDVSTRLRSMLFRCKGLPDDRCAGTKAYNELMKIAQSAADRNVRIQAVFKDEKNGHYYLPVHLLRLEDKRFLSHAVRVDYPLPVSPVVKPSKKYCVRNWAVGFIINDLTDYDNADMLRQWNAVMNRGSSSYRQVATLDDLRAYFNEAVQSVPEGLILFAHHGEGYITSQTKPGADHIVPGAIKRQFGYGSFAVMVSCSVGSLGEESSGNSRFLHSLNAMNIAGAVVSPFKVPGEVAVHFLNAMRDTLGTLKEDTTLYDVFEAARKRYRESATGDALYIADKVDAFMLVGDGDIIICKP